MSIGGFRDVFFISHHLHIIYILSTSNFSFDYKQMQGRKNEIFIAKMIFYRSQIFVFSSFY